MMGFYYTSVFSAVPLGIAYGALALIFWAISRATRGIGGRKVFLPLIAVAFLVLPVSEELWIAWNFGQACKESGTFIHKTVQTEGFYDATRESHSGPRNERAAEELDRGGFRFYEFVLRDRKDGSNQVVHLGKVNGQWTATVLDRPTARYHFRRTDSGAPWGHKIVKTQTVVLDAENNEQVARYTRFGRRPAWFFIGLDAPDFGCDSPGRWPLTPGDLLVFEKVLLPFGKK